MTGVGPEADKPRPDPAEIARRLTAGTVESLARARTREAAWNFAAEHPELFLLGLGRMEPGSAPFPQQLLTAKAILESFRGQAIVADEVGLGKTIVALLLAFEFRERDPSAKVLILTPANLLDQWIGECRTFFGLGLDDMPRAGTAQLSSESMVLLSIDRAKGRNIAPILLKERWDLLIIDEAHELRNQEVERSRFVYSLFARNRVYLTATPVQNSGYDIYHVVNSLRPGFLNVKEHFTDLYKVEERAVGEPDALQVKLRQVITRKRRTDVGKDGFALRRVETLQVKSWTDQEAAAYEQLLDLLRGVYRRTLGYAAPIRRSSGFEEHVSEFVLVAMLVLREMCSHTKAAVKTLDTKLRARLTALAQLGSRGAAASFTGSEGDDWGLRQLDRFLLVHGKNLDRPDAHAKANELVVQLKKLFGAKRSVLVYVCFRETLKILTQLAEENLEGVTIVDFHGDLSPVQKRQRRGLFISNKPACFLSMDAGGQGLNLQAADTVVNYDYPWNPMKVEQRIGRVDRYGQEAKVVRVINLVTMGTIERYVYDTLVKKIEVFKSVFGDIMSPLNVESSVEANFMLGIGELILSSSSTEEMRDRFDGLDTAKLRGYMDRYQRYVGRSRPWIGE